MPANSDRQGLALGSPSRARLEQLSHAGAQHLRPIYAAMLDAGIGYVAVPQNVGPFTATFPAGFVAIICDDTNCALGPSGFDLPSMRQLAGRAKAVALISCDIVPAVYSSAVAVAIAGHGALIVETRLERESLWRTFLKSAAPKANLLICTTDAGEA